MISIYFSPLRKQKSLMWTQWDNSHPSSPHTHSLPLMIIRLLCMTKGHWYQWNDQAYHASPLMKPLKVSFSLCWAEKCDVKYSNVNFSLILLTIKHAVGKRGKQWPLTHSDFNPWSTLHPIEPWPNVCYKYLSHHSIWNNMLHLHTDETETKEKHCNFTTCKCTANTVYTVHSTRYVKIRSRCTVHHILYECGCFSNSNYCVEHQALKSLLCSALLIKPVIANSSVNHPAQCWWWRRIAEDITLNNKH